MILKSDFQKTRLKDKFIIKIWKQETHLTLVRTSNKVAKTNQ